MERILSYPLSILAYLWFLFFICLFQPIQWVCFHVFGYEAHKKSADIFIFFLKYTLSFTFSSMTCKNRELIPDGKPLIFVANHQGTFDIIGMAWFLRKYHLKYVSKIELGKNIPSISFNLKHSGSVLIDRKNPRQALPMLKQMGEYIQKYHRSVAIYPEGTRTRNGKPKPFAESGLKILCKYAPDAYVVPLTINNSWKVFKFGNFPMGLGNKLTFTIHPPIAVADKDFATLFEQIEKTIVDAIIVD